MYYCITKISSTWDFKFVNCNLVALCLAIIHLHFPPFSDSLIIIEPVINFRTTHKY